MPEAGISKGIDGCDMSEAGISKGVDGCDMPEVQCWCVFEAIEG